MKNKVILMIMIVASLVIMPTQIFAADGKYISQNLDEVLTLENIDHDFSNYKETDDQITIYFFRGSGCSFCAGFLQFLNSIIGEYGKYFKVEAYEIWQNRNNAKLMEEVADFLGETADGVPFVIIGDRVFSGYMSEYDDLVKQQIKALYDSDDRYDVMEEMEKAKKEEAKYNVSGYAIIGWNALFVAAGTAVVILYNMKKYQQINSRLSRLEKKKSR